MCNILVVDGDMVLDGYFDQSFLSYRLLAEHCTGINLIATKAYIMENLLYLFCLC